MGEFKITVVLTLDGDKYCALIGQDLQDGIAGFGDTPADALIALAAEYKRTADAVTEPQG